MGRASFGGSQDQSQLFSFLFNEYADRLETLAERASDRARDEQRAADNDTIDRWQQGEITDEEFLAYVEGRIEESADSPEELTYWKKVQRDTEKSLLQEQITDTAEDIIDDIQAGKKSYADLRAFYEGQRKKLKPSDPLYDELSDQIEQVNDQVAANAIDGAIGGVDYRFRAGQMTGSAAGAELRRLAERYRVNDPQRYYSLLSQALEYEQYGGVFSAGGRGGSGGGGGGSSAASLNGTIDLLQGIEDRLGSLSEQFEAGEQVGSFTYITEDGSVATEDILLRDGDSTPSRAMRAADEEMLRTLDDLEAAYIEKGDLSAAGEVANRRMGFITDHIQPRNTISREMQANKLLGGLQSAIESAANSSNPVLAWRKVQAAASEIERWRRRLNTNIVTEQVKEIDEEKAAENPELRAAARRQTVVTDSIEDRTTAEFVQQADALMAVAQGVRNANSVESLGALLDPLSLMLGDSAADAFLQRASVAVDLVTGIPEGKYARVFIPGEGLVYTPLADTFTTVMGPNGPQSVPTRVPVGPDGNSLADERNGESLTTMAVEIDGRLETVYGVQVPAYFIGGERVSQSDYQSFVDKLSNTTDGKELEALQAMGAPSAYKQVLAPRADGKAGAVTWYQDQQGQWFKNRVTRGGGVPFIFSGKNARQAQQFANQINPQTGEAWDPTGRAFFNERDYQQKRETNVLEGVGDDWYDISTRGKRGDLKRAQQAEMAQQMKFGRMGPQQGLFGGGKVGETITKHAGQLGISLGAPTKDRPLFSGKGFSGFREGIDGGRALPKIEPRTPSRLPQLRPVRPSVLEGVDRPNVNVDVAGIRSRLSSVLGRRRPARQSSTRRPTYAGAGFSGLQE